MTSVDINGRFLTQNITGVQRYATEMVRALDHQLAADPELRSRYSMRVLSPAGAIRSLPVKHIPVEAVGRFRGNPWEQLELPRHAGGLLLNLCNTAPLLMPGVVTIHDASVFAVPMAYSRTFRSWYRTLLPLVGRRSRLVLTVSSFSRNELNQRAGIPLEKIRVISQGGEHMLRQPPDGGIFDRVRVQPGRYILAVGSRSPHKNLQGVLRAIALLGDGGLPLVAAGGSNEKVFNAPDLPEGSVHAAGYVTDSELRALYEQATCFVYPSLYEGFGLPPLEAMTCGCPVIVSRRASLPEVGGDAVLYCDPLNPEDVARQIRGLIQDRELRAEYRELGLARARTFTWQRASRALLNVLEDLEAA